jgi:hypothetical protein
MSWQSRIHVTDKRSRCGRLLDLAALVLDCGELVQLEAIGATGGLLASRIETGVAFSCCVYVARDTS